MSSPVFFSLGNKTHRVPMTLYQENRARVAAALRAACAAAGTPCGVVLLQGGEAASRNDTDHEPLFRQESFFAYLFGVTESGFYGTLDCASGEAVLFAPRLPAEYAVWMGRIPLLSELRAKYDVFAVRHVDELGEALAGASVVHLLCGRNSDSGALSVPASFPGLDALRTDASPALHTALCACRSIKSPAEVELLRYVARVSSEAHVYVMRAARAGMREYQLESLFLHHCYMWGGCRFVSYTCICATGSRAAVLHYGHSGAPNDAELQQGAMALLDMGAEYACYGSDITRSFPIGGTFSDDARLVYDAVLAAQDAVFAALRPGVEWTEMHRLAERVILAALTRGGLLRGSAEEQAAANLGSVFMPHGLGHLLGCDTHDVGGYPLGGAARVQGQGAGLSKLRMNRVLEAGMVLTVEPGCYFIDCLLEAAAADAAQAPLLVAEQLNRFRGFGGVRLEDDVLITQSGFENFTLCPRSVEEVEAVMAGGAWPPPPQQV